MWSQKKSNGKYQFTERFIQPDGTTRTFSVTLEKDNAQFRKLARQMLEEKASKMPSNKFTLGQVLADYKAEKSRTNKPQSVHVAFSVLSNAVSLVGENMPLQRLTAGYIRSVILATGKQAAWMNRALKKLKGMLIWAYNNDYMQERKVADKIQYFEEPKKPKKVEDKFLTADELRAVLAAMKERPHYRLAVEFLALTGLRIGEFVALEAADVTDDTITVNKTYSLHTHKVGSPKSASSVREIHIQPELQDCIRRINAFIAEKRLAMPRIRDCRLFFPGVSHVYNATEYFSIYQFQIDFNAICGLVTGKPLTPHALRHTHASLLYEAGFTPEQVARRLGHASPNVTRDIYIHVTDKRKELDNTALDRVRLLS